MQYIVPFLATVEIEPTTLCCKVDMLTTWLKVQTASQVASSSLYEVSEGYDIPPK